MRFVAGVSVENILTPPPVIFVIYVEHVRFHYVDLEDIDDVAAAVEGGGVSPSRP